MQRESRNMTQKCCVKDCEELVKETRARCLPLHKFPKDPAQRTSWLATDGFPDDFRPTPSQIVCYKHFRQSDYEVSRGTHHKLFLKKGSVPSVFDDYDNHPDPIRSDLIATRLQARELKNSQQQQVTAPTGSQSAAAAGNNSSQLLDDSLNDTAASITSYDGSADDSTSQNLGSSSIESTGVSQDADSISTQSTSLQPAATESSQSVGSPMPVAQTIGIDETEPKQTVDSSKAKIINRSDIVFSPGFKLEAKDFNDVWYSARVVEVDHQEKDVLIHFDKWSTRYDEWIPMDSSRLRMMTQSPKEQNKTFEVGENVMATWVDGVKYPAQIKTCLGNDKYNVLFYDGFTKALKASKITKLPQETPAVQPFKTENTYVGSKQERRDRKRKHTITELFSHKKKSKLDNEKVAKKEVQEPETSSQKIVQKADVIQTQEPAKLDVTTEVQTPMEIPVNPIGSDPNDSSILIGSLRVETEDSALKCPKEGCRKLVRKEHLLIMHIKHYHPEFVQYLGVTPNVADLAYARTVGEPVEDVVPKKSRISTSTPNYTSSRTSSSCVEKEIPKAESEIQAEIKIEAERSNSIHEDSLSERSTVNSCTMSPGTLFDMRKKDERTHTGIKTLLPVRHPSSFVFDEPENSGPQNAELEICKPSSSRGMKKKLTSESSIPPKSKKQRQFSENSDSFLQLDDSVFDQDDTLHPSDNSSLLNSTKLTNDIPSDIIPPAVGDTILVNGELIKVEKLRKEEIINCTCGSMEEDGLMIQCDLCQCWQHSVCNAIEREQDVPDKYICYICRNPQKQRTSKKYFHDQDWIREGILPKLNTIQVDPVKYRERSAMLKRAFDVMNMVLQTNDVLHSLRVKINIAQNKDHPKLYLWAKSWSKIKIPSYQNEPVPLLEKIKDENDNNDDSNIDNLLDTSNISLSLKTEDDQKLMASDSDTLELMKILEDPGDDTKNGSLVKDENKILLDVLTRDGLEADQMLENHHDLLSSDPTKKTMDLGPNDKSPMISAQPAASQSIAEPPKPFIPEPEAAIDPLECKSRLLEHIENLQKWVDSTLNFIEVQIEALEEKFEWAPDTNDRDMHTSQTLLMVLNDLKAIRKLAALS
ncbi:PHD finger protein 20-like [Trichogramma pretiosum]|uniref:PHD finger protein 20-like n=1 Tax=Trichogramma pretiosum TaxID=7493 RepID=UPI0006C9CF56|nr:PHD finger protein 20-like [Trichogramma pretiosum]